MLARMVVISYVPSSATTSGSAWMTSSGVMMTSVWSACRYSATSRAYFRSMASLHMPMANVRMGFLSSFAEMAHTRLLSRPPESRKPSGASASSRFSTPAMSFSRMWVQTVSRSSSQTASTCVMSR